MSAARLPIFPLGMVLFPGTSAPLHLFEPRYRQLLVDVQGTDSRFGIFCGLPGVPERDLPRGRVGCVAEVTAVDMLDDGRSNILVVGRERFALEAFVEHDAPYHVADVAEVHDVLDTTPLALTLMGDEVASNFLRVARAVHTLNNDDSSIPSLPEDPSQLAWTIASMIDLHSEARQQLLSDTSPSSRLTTIDRFLRRALSDLEFRAAMHRQAP